VVSQTGALSRSRVTSRVELYGEHLVVVTKSTRLPDRR